MVEAMTPDDAARKALEQCHTIIENHANWLPSTARRIWHRAINRLARAAWEAGRDYGYDSRGDDNLAMPSWLPPKQTEST